jgi:hypothetical protein
VLPWNWDAPESEACNARIGAEPCLIERISRLKVLTFDVRAGCRQALQSRKMVAANTGSSAMPLQSPMVN